MILRDPAATEAFGRQLSTLVCPGDVITLQGDLGAGKTSLARGLLAGLGLAGEAPSPSFAIVQPYAPPEVRIPVLHVDLYRIDDPAELEELGLDEAQADSVTLVEWPERAVAGYWPDALALRLDVEGAGAALDSPSAGGLEAAMADMTPPAGAADFLARHGWAGAAIAPLAGDASFRRYFRVTCGERSAVLMDAPPPHEDPRPFLGVAGWLAERGFAAPVIHAADADAGLVLLEDFGDVRLRETIDADAGAEHDYYVPAVDLLAELARHPAGPLEPYDTPVLLREAALFVDWYCPAVGLDVDREGWEAAWRQVLPHALAAEPVTVLRDYHAENLMLVGEDRRLGLLDFQDALAGHPAYDLVSLLQDARRDVDPSVEEAMLARYRAATGAGDDFLRAYHVLGCQRNAKIIGIFTRLWQRDGKPRYPALCPRVWGYLERGLSQPVMAPVAAWLDANVPPEKRGDPLRLGA